MTENKELISIIVPVYKVEEYLSRCVDSIRKQTYQNLEIILVDDGSPDNCPHICDTYSKIDKRIKVIHKANGGLSSARNAGIDIAKGIYIGFVDSDDYIESTMFERLHEGAVKYGCDIAICNHFVEKGDKLLMEMPPVDKECVYQPKEAVKLLIDDKVIRSYAWDKLYKIELFHGIRYPNGRNYEDIATTYLLFDKANKICQVQELGYYYQIHENSISCNNTKSKWHKNCRDMVASMYERYLYFSDKNDRELEELSLGKMIPMMITYIMLSYQQKTYHDIEQYKQFLREHMYKIEQNQYISQRDKKITNILTYPHWISSIAVHSSGLKNKSTKFKKGIAKIKRAIKKNRRFDFSLKPGKQIRVFLFELPCFDNMGDHAIAYAEMKFFEKMCEEIPELQVIEVLGWNTAPAVKQLLKEKRKSDIFICQGGGNMGNLYEFGEQFRRKIMKAFPEHFILVFPQTMHFTKDIQGKRELNLSKKVYNKCKNLTLLARDQISYEKMKKEFQCNVIPMVDVVTSINGSEYSSKNREGSILCLRSDVESALKAEDKKNLNSICKKYFSKNIVTDTVSIIEIKNEDREKVLIAKWRMFGNAEVVVTDRLHGMIFAFITQTPCIVLGNNHHKVKESYKTLSKCNYLYYVDSVDEVESIMMKIKNAPIQAASISFHNEFKELSRYIVDKLGMV